MELQNVGLLGCRQPTHFSCSVLLNMEYGNEVIVVHLFCILQKFELPVEHIIINGGARSEWHRQKVYCSYKPGHQLMRCIIMHAYSTWIEPVHVYTKIS